MLEAFWIVFEQMLRIIMLIGVGFASRRLHLLPEHSERAMSRLVTTLFLPALLLHTNLLECRMDSLADNWELVVCGTAVCLVSMGLAFWLSPWFARGDRYDEGVFRYAISFSNSGAVGTPLVLAMLGTAGLFQYSLFQFILLLLNYSWGILQLQPVDKRSNLRQAVRGMLNPAMAVQLIAIVLGVLGAGDWMPNIVIDSVGQLGSCYVPVSLLLVGYNVAGFSLKYVFGDIRSYIYSALRLVVIPGVFLIVLRLLGLPDIMCVMAVLYLACPCGMNTVVFPASYGMDCKASVGMVLVSSVLAMLTAPLMYALTTI